MAALTDQTHELGIDLDRVKAYLASGPADVASPASLIEPGLEASKEIWPLIARRNLKRLLIALARVSDRDADSAAQRRRIILVLNAMSDDALDHVLSEPEVTSWLASPTPDAWDGRRQLDVLARLVVASAASSHVQCDSLRVATSSDLLTLRHLGMDIDLTGIMDSSDGVWAAAAGDGSVVVNSGAVELTVEPAAVGSKRHDRVRPLPRTFGDAIVKGLPDPWLATAFPDVDNVSPDPGFAADLAAKVQRGMDLVHDAWPEMASEIASLLRWVVPMRAGDSFFVPAFRGLVALPDSTEANLGLMVIHELSHNIISCLYDLVDIVKNPDDRVRSPFSRELEPLSSVLHSCWAFSHELRAIHRLRETGALDEKTDWDRILVKIKVFYDQAFPLIRSNAHLTPYGESYLAAIEEQVYR